MMDELRMIAWEITRRCNLSCVHCRASAQTERDPDELTTEECFRLLDDIASFSQPVIILTGGEPLLREDVFEIAHYGNELGLRMVMAVNGTLVDEETAQKMQDVGIQRISVSIDGATAETHDRFRQVPGAFDAAIQGIKSAKKVGLEFQINSSLTMKPMKKCRPRRSRRPLPNCRNVTLMSQPRKNENHMRSTPNDANASSPIGCSGHQ